MEDLDVCIRAMLPEHPQKSIRPALPANHQQCFKGVEKRSANSLLKAALQRAPREHLAQESQSRHLGAFFFLLTILHSRNLAPSFQQSHFLTVEMVQASHLFIVIFDSKLGLAGWHIDQLGIFSH